MIDKIKKIAFCQTYFNKALSNSLACLLAMVVFQISFYSQLTAQTLASATQIESRIKPSGNTSNTSADQAALDICETTQAGVLYKNSNDGSLVGSVNSIQSALNSESHLWQQGRGLTEGAYIELMVSQPRAIADGQSHLKLAIKVFNQAGSPLLVPTRLNIDTSLGRLAVNSQSTDTKNMEIVTTTGQACLFLVSPTLPGVAKLSVSSGTQNLTGEIQFTPDLKPLMVMGFVEGVAGKVKFNKDALTPYIQTTGFEDSIQKFEKTHTNLDDTIRRSMGVRASFFIKGAIKGEYLLTAAYDSEKQVQQQLFKDIDPNAFYPVYGDSSNKGFDVQSNSPLFVRLDHQTSYFLYGDFATLSANPASQLANYSRSTTGIKNHFENQNVKATIWASQEALRAYVDEQPARGISGPYSVAQANAIANSEKIELIVRSRDNPNLILKREVLVRFTDYDFEPFTGKVVFRKAVPSIDEGFNPVFIRISYEVNTGGEKYWLAGAEAQVQLGALTLGASHVQDRTPYAPYQISGVNAELKISENTNAVVELARSQGSQFYNRSIESLVEANSGFSQDLGGVIPSTQTQSGNAARVELNHKSQNAQFKLQYSEAQSGFQNSQAAVLPNRQDLAIGGQYQVQADLAVQAQVLSYKDLNAHSKKELTRLGIVYEANPAFTLEASLKQVKEEGRVGDLSANTTASAYSSLSNLGWANGASSGAGLVRSQTSSTTANSNTQTLNGQPQNTIQNDYTSAEIKANLAITKDIQLNAEYEASIHDLTKNRSAVGAQYQLNENSKMYAKAEFNNNLEAQVNGTNIQGTTSRQAVVGIDAEYIKNGQIFSEYRLNDVGQGLNASSAVGLRQLWKVSEALTLNTGIEQVKTIAYDDSLETARAYNLGFLHQPNSETKWGGKLELRDSNISQQWLGTAAFDYKMSDEWTAIARDIYIAQNYKLVSSNGELTQNQLQAGLAYRDLATNRLSVLTKLELRSENSTALNDEKDNQTTVASVHVNYRPLRNITLQAQAAQKIVRDRVAQHEIRWRASLLAAKVNFELSDIVDVSLMGSVAQSNGTLIRGYGAELGLKLYKNLRLGLSYTEGNYSDLELFSANASWSGWHAKLSMKFDDVPFNGNRQMIN